MHAATDPTTITQTGPAGTPPAPPQAPDLSVTSAHSGAFAQGDATDSYTITVSNPAAAGPAAGLVTVTDSLPAGLTALSMSGPGWSCQPTTATCATNGGVTLAAGAHSDITLKVGVSANAPPSLQTLMQASGGGEVAAAGLDENNDYDVVSNGGADVNPTYVTPRN